MGASGLRRHELMPAGPSGGGGWLAEPPGLSPAQGPGHGRSGSRALGPSLSFDLTK